MQGKRKLLITILVLIVMTLILLLRDYDPLALGGGFATVLVPIMYGYGKEYGKQ